MDWQSPTALERLHALVAKPRLGIITGMDGTISPVVEDPGGAPPSPHCRELLDALAQHIPLVAVISARPATDMRMLVDSPHLVYAGNRGMETWAGGRLEISPEVQQFRPALEAVMTEVFTHIAEPMHIEDVGSAILVHYEGVDDLDAIGDIRVAMQAIADRSGLRFFDGFHTLEVRPPLLVNKGTALSRLANTYTLDGVMCFGNGIADLDAFAAVHARRTDGLCDGLAVGVIGDWTASAVADQADIMTRGIPGVEAMLAWLLEERTARVRYE